MAELSWTSEIIYYSECGQDQNWVSITPAQGTSSSSPIVSVKAATSPNDCPRASIIITSNGETQIIPVVRCLPECECKSINFVPNALLKKLEATGGTVELGKYDVGACVEYMKVVTDGTVICEPNIQGGKVTATVQENPSTSPRTGSYKVLLDAEECVKTHEIVQDGKVDPCATAVCPTVTPPAISFSFGGGETGYTIGGKDKDCWTLTSVIPNKDWITADTTSSKISVGRYTGTTQRTGNVTFNFVNKSGSSDPCSQSIGITQTVSTCTCNDLKLTGDTISYEPKDSVQIGSFTTTCVENISATTSSEKWVTNLKVEGTKIMANVTENESTEEPRTSTITVTGTTDTGNCRKTFDVTQNKKVTSCTTCEDANIQGLSGSATAKGGTNIQIGSFSYSCDPGLTAKRVSGGDFITNMTVNNGNVYGTVSANTETTPRTEEIGIYLEDNTTQCAHYTFTQQGAKPSTCTCHDITLSNSAVTIDSDGTKTKIGTITQGCEVGFTGTPWITISVEGSNIMVSASANETIEPRIGGGSIGIKDVGSCKEIKVTQLGVLKTYDITVYPTYSSSIDRVTVDVDYDGVSSPGSTYFRLKKEGCSVNIMYDNCIGSTASPILPAGNTIPICVEQGSGGESSIQKNAAIITKTVACTFIIGGNEETQTSHDDVKEYTYLNFIYRVIVKTNR